MVIDVCKEWLQAKNASRFEDTKICRRPHVIELFHFRTSSEALIPLFRSSVGNSVQSFYCVLHKYQVLNAFFALKRIKNRLHEKQLPLPSNV
jgi:hypothetical protein